MCSLSKHTLLSVLLCVLYHVVSGQIYDPSTNYYQQVFVTNDNFDASYLDTLEVYWEKAEPDTIRFAILNDLAYYWHTRNLNTSLNYTLHGLSLTGDYPLWEGRLQITLGSILLRMEKLDSALMVLNDAKTKVKESDMAFLNTQLGYVFERKGELDKAADFALESLSLGEKLDDQKAIALAYSDLSNIFWKQSRFDQGLEYGLRSIDIFEERGINDLDFDFTLYVVGNNYLALNEHENALLYFNRSIEMGERYGFHNNLSDVYISLVDLYTFLERFEQAEEAGTNAVKYAELLENDFMIMRSWLSIGKMQLMEGKFEKAIQSLSTCIEVATEEFGDEYYLSQAYQHLAEAQAALGNYDMAYESMLIYEQLKDRIFTAEADQRISLLQTEFDVQLKESTIKLQETKLAQQSTRQTIIIIIAGSLLLLTVILYLTYQSNKRKNKLLQKQNSEKEFLLKEIHHRVKNNLETISGLLALQSEQLSDSAAVDAMQESQNRVQSMSMIHQKLYQGTNLSTIEMKDYFRHLGNHILDSFGMEEQVNINYKMEKLELDVDTAIPLGLIVNELLTNAMKYAFPGSRKGKLRITLSQGLKENLHLEVADDGVGQDHNGASKGTGFGSQLVELLCRQLQGVMSVTSDKGTVITFDFQSA